MQSLECSGKKKRRGGKRGGANKIFNFKIKQKKNNKRKTGTMKKNHK